MRFYRHSLFGRPSGGPIFRCTTKDRGERRAKGLQSRPLESGFYTGVRRGDVPTSYEFAVMQLTRFRPVRGVLRTASTDSIVLHVVRRNRWHFKNNRRNLWSEVGLLRKSCCLSEHRSTQRQGDKRQRRSRRNRVTRTIAKWFAQSTSGILQNIAPGIQGAAAPWHAFLPYLSSCNERWGHRRSLV